MRISEAIQIINRSFYLQALFTNERMLSIGFVSCILPFAKRWFSDKEELQSFVNRSLEFFNTQPYMVSWIVGALIKIEETRGEEPVVSVEQTVRFKKRMSEVIGAIGDRFFWHHLKPLTALLSVMIAYSTGPWNGIAFFLVSYNIPHFYQRVVGLFGGYREGLNLVKNISLKRYEPFLKRLGMLASFVGGFGLATLGWKSTGGQLTEIGIFAISAIAMFFFLRLKLPVTTGLLILMGGLAIFGIFY